MAFSQCQVSTGQVTVQIGSSAVAAKDLVAVADDLLETFRRTEPPRIARTAAAELRRAQ